MTRALGAAAAAALMLAGCGGLDSDRIEDELAKAIETQTGVPVASADCPDDLDSEKGQTFQCTARGENGGRAVIDVRQVDDDGKVEFRARDLTPLGGPAQSGR